MVISLPSFGNEIMNECVGRGFLLPAWGSPVLSVLMIPHRRNRTTHCHRSGVRYPRLRGGVVFLSSSRCSPRTLATRFPPVIEMLPLPVVTFACTSFRMYAIMRIKLTRLQFHRVRYLGQSISPAPASTDPSPTPAMGLGPYGGLVTHSSGAFLAGPRIPRGTVGQSMG